MERILGAPTVRLRIGQRTDHVEKLDDRPRPAVREEDRQGICVLGTHMQKVNSQTVERRAKLWKRVEPALKPPHVIPISPIVDESLSAFQLDALRPVGDGFPFGPACRCEPSPEILDHGRRDGDTESSHSLRGGWQIDPDGTCDRQVRRCLGRRVAEGTQA